MSFLELKLKLLDLFKEYLNTNKNRKKKDIMLESLGSLMYIKLNLPTIFQSDISVDEVEKYTMEEYHESTKSDNDQKKEGV